MISLLTSTCYFIVFNYCTILLHHISSSNDDIIQHFADVMLYDDIMLMISSDVQSVTYASGAAPPHYHVSSKRQG
jgi:hypothetical protein